MKLRMWIELDYDADAKHGDDEEAIQWFKRDVLLTPPDGGELFLWSNEIGDEIGQVRVLKLEEGNE